MPKLPFSDSEYYDQNDNDEKDLTPEEMGDIISFVGGETDENPFPNKPVCGAPGGATSVDSTESSIRGAMANKTHYPTGKTVKLTKKELRNLSIEEARKLFEVEELVEPEKEYMTFADIKQKFKPSHYKLTCVKCGNVCQCRCMKKYHEKN